MSDTFRFYAQFLTFNKETGEALNAPSPDGTYPLSKNSTKESMVYDSKERMDYLKSTHPEYIGFAVMQKRYSKKSIRISKYHVSLPKE